ncbi:MAG: NAD(P)-dependent oxidoreductase [Candidatus Bathyarchaeia archaeon]|nr:NAD(P)-dependent oxidoreductase [Candidatus Bathyarchaeia archaeon]
MGEQKKKVLVTGGSGFIGSNLVRELNRRGHEVWLCDLMNRDKENFVRCDVSKYRQVERMFDAHDFDYVYHAAAEYGRWNGEDYYENLWSTNAVGTQNILRMQEKKRFRLIFFSSAEVYGDYDGVMSEDVMDAVEIKQMNDYALSKWVNELQILNSAAMFGTETVRVRLFNLYGPGEHYTPYRGWIPKFIFRALHDMPYTVYLGHKRTLEYIEDVCRAFANIIDNFKPGEVYNFGGDEQYEVKFVSDLILELLGKNDSKVCYKEAEAFTTRVKTPDSSKAKRDLHLKLTMPVEDGMKKTVDWFAKLYGKESVLLEVEV